MGIAPNFRNRRTEMDNNRNESITLVDRINNLLNDGKTQAALELITKSKQMENPRIGNARAVCLMRLGKFEEAVSQLAAIVFPGRVVAVAPGTPVVYITNLAISMLKVNNITGALSLFKQIEQKDRNHPAAVKLEQTIKDWKRSLNIFDKFQLATGVAPKKTVVIENENADGDLQ
jgi:hypothetical protein